MKNTLGKEQSAAGKSRPKTGLERRESPRQPFIAEAQIVELKSGAKLIARSCDLVVHGCYVDTMNPFPIGTSVRIRLKKDNTVVEASGRVVYGIPGLGMGVAFQNLTPSNQSALERWLSTITMDEEFFNALVPPIVLDEPTVVPNDRPAELAPAPSVEQMSKLIRMLTKKGLLTRDEAATLLNEPIDT